MDLKDDDFDWTRQKGSTPSINTGPSFDHTYGTTSGESYVLCHAQSNHLAAILFYALSHEDL